jgi:adenylate cyclase
MDHKASFSEAFSAIEEQLIKLNNIVEQLNSFLQRTRSAAIPPFFYEGVNKIGQSLNLIRKSADVLEEERRSMRALADMGRVVNTSIELDVVLQLAIDTIIRLTGAERAFLMLRNEQDELTIRIARSWEQETIESSELAISRTIIYRVADEGFPVLTTNAKEDPRFTDQASIAVHNLRSILCVPLKVKDQVTGVIYADNRVRSGIFTQKDLDLLTGFANQAAVALENARLFDSVRRTLAEVTELKNMMDNIFSSIASGVVTADIQERILLCNQAAENILGLVSYNVVGHDISEAFPPLNSVIQPYLNQVMLSDQPVVGLEASPKFASRGQIDLRLSLSPLKNAQKVTQGIAIVLEDLTEKKHLEASRRLFEKMVSPAVIDQLDPDSLHLGGTRAEITILFADIRGFTSFSEQVKPEELVNILNKYLAAAAEAILAEGGTIDKFLGDAVMSWFNAPILQQDHTFRAVKAALAIRSGVQNLHKQVLPSSQLTFGIGIHMGEAVLGLVGTEKRLEYTAIGDSVNTTKRIQEHTGINQILISEEAYFQVRDQVIVAPSKPIQAKGKRMPIQVFEVIGLRKSS